jgi:hypothetical protein
MPFRMKTRPGGGQIVAAGIFDSNYILITSLTEGIGYHGKTPVSVNTSCHACPLGYQKRVVEFGEWLCASVLKAGRTL